MDPLEFKTTFSTFRLEHRWLENGRWEARVAHYDNEGNLIAYLIVTEEEEKMWGSAWAGAPEDPVSPTRLINNRLAIHHAEQNGYDITHPQPLPGSERVVIL